MDRGRGEVRWRLARVPGAGHSDALAVDVVRPDLGAGRCPRLGRGLHLAYSVSSGSDGHLWSYAARCRHGQPCYGFRFNRYLRRGRAQGVQRCTEAVRFASCLRATARKTVATPSGRNVDARCPRRWRPFLPVPQVYDPTRALDPLGAPCSKPRAAGAFRLIHVPHPLDRGRLPWRVLVAAGVERLPRRLFAVRDPPVVSPFVFSHLFRRKRPTRSHRDARVPTCDVPLPLFLPFPRCLGPDGLLPRLGYVAGQGAFHRFAPRLRVALVCLRCRPDYCCYHRRAPPNGRRSTGYFSLHRIVHSGIRASLHSLHPSLRGARRVPAPEPQRPDGSHR
ncbi:hypothetical protein DFJ74DRAFT_692286 [Hyaloraphidium curvatum]|nr:hypothetical protein DFJ74DRAFT_692286 [Hyaloraphidium curvatum]